LLTTNLADFKLVFLLLEKEHLSIEKIVVVVHNEHAALVLRLRGKMDGVKRPILFTGLDSIQA
jgi:hypothetical protein